MRHSDNWQTNVLARPGAIQLFRLRRGYVAAWSSRRLHEDISVLAHPLSNAGARQLGFVGCLGSESILAIWTCGRRFQPSLSRCVVAAGTKVRTRAGYRRTARS